MESIEKNKYCKNCHNPLSESDLYCSQCSQKYTTGKISLLSFFKEFIGNVFNLDSKVYRTTIDLFKPGKLTNEYFKGRHKRYAHPVRLFLLVAIVHFAALSYWMYNTDGLIQYDVSDIKDGHLISTTKHDFINKFKEQKIKVDSSFSSSKVSAALDSLSKPLINSDSNYKDSINIITNINGSKKMAIAKKDFLETPIDSIYKKYKIEGFNQQLLIKQQIKFLENPGRFINFFIGRLSVMALLLMPILAFFFKLLYIRKRRYYIEHLVFCFHLHAFAFLLLTIVLLLTNYIPRYLTASIILSIFAYQFIAMRNVYKQGRRKTFLKFCLLSVLYFFAFVAVLTLTLFLSFFLF